MSDSTDFEVLVKRLRSGDQDAARELLSRYEDAVRRFIRVRLSDPALKRQMESMDICQSVMADFFARTALGQFDLQSPEQLIALLATMAKNRIINHTKKQRAQRRDIRRMEPGDVADFQPAAGSETPSQIVAGRELIDAFRKRLSAEELDLAERRSRGEAWADIGRALGARPDALRVRLARALERASAELGLDDSRYE